MTVEIRANPAASGPTWPVWLAGMLALAVAMGIGRFAFTPLLPLMMRDGLIDQAGGAEMAVANYLGYLAGALSAGIVGRDPMRLLRLALPLVALLTAAVGAVDGLAAWSALRFGAGVCSAWVLVATSSWTLRELAERRAGAAGSLVFAGVGIGIAGTGAWVWLAGSRPAATLWQQLGLGAAVVVVTVWLLTRSIQRNAPGATAASPPAQRLGSTAWAMVICYGSFGFGYIVPATYLPAMARGLVDDPAVFGLAWPLFGLAATISTLLATRVLAGWSNRRIWALAQGLMALGTALPLFNHSLPAIVLAALLVGGTFMVATMAGLQLARQLAPTQPTVLISRMTAAFAAGQIAGPLLVRLLDGAGLRGAQALEATSVAAVVLLAASAAWLWRDSARP